MVKPQWPDLTELSWKKFKPPYINLVITSSIRKRFSINFIQKIMKIIRHRIWIIRSTLRFLRCGVICNKHWRFLNTYYKYGLIIYLSKGISLSKIFDTNARFLCRQDRSRWLFSVLHLHYIFQSLFFYWNEMWRHNKTEGTINRKRLRIAKS